MYKGKKVVVVGIPGVGKTTVLSCILEYLNKRKTKAEVAVFGNVMLDQAKKNGIKDRDSLRKLPVNMQRQLQINAAKSISMITDGIKFVDTHLFINTAEGYWPGLPINVLEVLSPTNLVLIEADPSEILSRRRRDTSRIRDKATKKSILHEMEIARHILSTSAVITGAPMLIIGNSEGQSSKAARRIVQAISGKK